MKKKQPLFFLLPAILFLSLLFLRVHDGHAQAYLKSSRLYATNARDSIQSFLADDDGNTYLLVTGVMNAFPVTTGGPAVGTGAKTILAKHNADGEVVWSRYLPHSSSGAGLTRYTKMELRNNQLYLLGVTTAADVPVTNGTTAGSGGSDVVFARINAGDGSVLLSSYLGGNGFDGGGIDMQLDNAAIYITYTTTSSDVGTTYTGGYDHVISKMDDQANITWSRLTGRVSNSILYTDSVSLQVDNGHIYLAMVVNSDNDFATTNGSTVLGNHDFGIVKFDAAGNKVLSFVYGGTKDEVNPVIAIDNSEIYLSGHSTSVNYPVTDASSFAGYDRKHVLTKFNSGGTVAYSSYLAGLYNPGRPLVQVHGGAVYTMLSTTGSPVVNVTDGSTGSTYLVKLNASNGQVQFATRFGGNRFAIACYAYNFIISDDKIYTATISASGVVATDGSPLIRANGIYFSVYSLSGARLFGTHWSTGAFSNGGGLVAKSGNKVFVGSTFVSLPSSYIPATEMEGTLQIVANASPISLQVYEFCPPMPAENDIAPLSQEICANGLTQILTGNKVAFASTDMAEPVRNGITYQQMEIQARYQWQVSTSPTGPWTNIPGPGTQKDFMPPSLSDDRYYRRVVLPPLGCGDDPVSISDVAAVTISVNAAPTVTSGIFNTCAGESIDVSVDVTGGVPPYAFAWSDGIASTTETATVIPTANSVYTVIVTDDAGCQQVGQVIVNGFVADAGPADINVCLGTPVRLGVAPPAGLAGVTYSWSPATGLDDPNIAQPLATPAVNTVYTLTMTVPVTGGGTCMTVDDVAVNVVAGPADPNFAGEDKAVCKAGTVTLGGTPEAGFSYTWAPGNFLSTVSSLSTTFDAGSELPVPNPMTYQVTATKNGCTVVDEVTVAVLDVDAGKDLCGPRRVGTGDKMPGVTGKTYLWEKITGPGNITGPVDEAYTDVSASVGGSTTYRLTVSYLGVSCSDEVVVPECGADACPVLDIEVLAEQGCPNTSFGQVQLRALPQNLLPGEWTYTWSAVPAGGLSNTNGSLVTLTDNVERDVTVTITSVDNPSISCSETIHVNAPAWSLPVYSVGDHVVCPGTTLSIGGAPVAGYSFQWQNVDDAQANFSDPTVTVDVTTHFILSVTDDLSGCIRKDTAIVTVNPVIIDAGADWITCSNAVLQLGTPAIPGYTYSWLPEVASYQDGTDHLTANPKVLVATSQDFTLTVTDTETGCSEEATVHIVVDNSSTLPPMQDHTICRGGDGVVIGMAEQPGVTYSWSPATGLSSSTVANPVANPTSTQVYTLTVTYFDENDVAICTKTGDVTVTVNGPEISGMADVIICPSDAAHDLGDGITVNGTEPLTYSWTPYALVNNPTTLNATLKANPTKPTNFTFTVTDANGCKVTQSKLISPAVNAPIAGSNSMICVGSSIVLGDATNSSSSNWSVSPAISGTLNTLNAAQPVFTPAAGDAGKVFVFTVSQESGGCTSTSQVAITVNQYSLPAMTPQMVCNNASAIIGVEEEAGVSYSWSPVEGLDNPNMSMTTANNITSTKQYTLTAIDHNGCMANANVLIGVNPTSAPEIVIPDVTATVGSTPEAFQPQITPAGTYSYTWSPAGKVDNPYIANARANGTGIGTSTYTLSVTDENGCTSVAQANLTVHPAITLPVTLSSINATVDECNVKLNWEIETADNFSHFIVERRKADGSFEAVMKITHENMQKAYSYMDVHAGQGVNSYRLKLVDLDGSFEYSKIVSARKDCGLGAPVVYPNPFNGVLHVEYSQRIKELRLVSITGNTVLRQVYNQLQPAIVQLRVDRLLHQGIYLLQIVTMDGGVKHVKLVRE